MIFPFFFDCYVQSSRASVREVYLYLFLELGMNNQDSNRQFFYGHADIVTLFSPAEEMIGVRNVDIYDMYLTNALAVFLIKSTRSIKTPKSTATPKYLQIRSNMCAPAPPNTMNNSTPTGWSKKIDVLERL